MTPPLLVVEDLAFGHGRRPVGSGLSFTVAGGEALALLGPNGSGKTTLFRTVLGLLPALGGTVRLAGEDIAGWSPERRARAFGYVPQAAPGFFPFSVLETVVMGRTARLGLFAAPAADDWALGRRILAELGIAHLAERDCTRISGGERQLALVARALAQEPRVLVLDEPTASLDYGNQQLVLDVVAELRGRGLAILLSTHHPDHAFACASHAALLKDGRLTGFGPVDSVVTGGSLSRLYGIAIEVVGVGGRRVCMRGAPAGPAAA
ncbi:ABC transporter ATP-binding protein [Propylenella binzhouense]|uniref:ABC transporter ATP-binding protein n=1 Tax=Propylenella binzhouense TaxID=2555902 RepID=A0A964T8K8_9HYPH|nr:ABC transporter ATP-binding protein [Propylenella binzhouense]MYZ50475.1 ABC transporter ATP-binding protein [Propylenella binzhouense]